MNIKISLVTQDRGKKQEWSQQLQEILDKFHYVNIHVEPTDTTETTDDQLGQIVLVDALLEDLHIFLAKIDRTHRVVLLVSRDLTEVPQLVIRGTVDDVLVTPFRTLELYSKLQYYQQALNWQEFLHIHSLFSELLPRLHEDIQLAEQLQKSKLPQRFPEVKGFKVSSRYLAGIKPGGDYFDIAETKNGKHLSIILSHSSSYGLSSTLLSILMRVALKTSVNKMNQSGAIVEMVQRIYDELLLALGEKDQLSLFYGVISRETHTFRWLNLGNSVAFLANPNEPFRELPRQGEKISRESNRIADKEGSIALPPESRLVLVSAGFTDELGGTGPVLDILNQHRHQDPTQALNELAFRVKSKLKSEDDFPHSDCTVITFDANSQVVRLARRESSSR